MTCIEAVVEVLAEAHEEGMIRADLYKRLDGWCRGMVSQQVSRLKREGTVVEGYPYRVWLTESAPSPLPVNPRPGKTVPVVCEQCGDTYEARKADVRRGRRYCGHACAVLARHGTLLTDEEKKARKSEYDAKYREENRERICAEKRESYYANHDKNLKKQAELRADPEYRERMREYGKQYRQDPEWKRHKREYDRKYRAEKQYGEDFAPAYLAFLALTEQLQTIDGGNKARQHERGRGNRVLKSRREFAKESEQ